MAYLIYLVLLACISAANSAVPQICQTSKVGCFSKDDGITADLLINNRDTGDKNDGFVIEWQNYTGFVQGLMCRCASMARASPKNYTHIVLRFYGLCIGATSLPGGQLTTGTSCAETWEIPPTDGLKKCTDANTTPCVGEENTDYYYKLGVDGGVSDWGQWSVCSLTCGTGVQRRNRTCSNPPPSGNGSPCAQPLSETKSCVGGTCPVDGGFSEWSNWGVCSKSCGGGERKRIRTCDNPPPQNGGFPCDGFFELTEQCNTQICASDGNWGQWSAYTVCTQTCGGGISRRTRLCNNPAPATGGKTCVGSAEETKGCINGLCPGIDTITKSQELVDTFLKNYHRTTFPGTVMSARFNQAIFAIQQSVATEAASTDPDVLEKTPAQRLSDLQELLQAAIQGNSIDFARSIFGKTFYTLIQQQLDSGFALDAMDPAAERFVAQIKSTIGNTSYDGLISSHGDVTLMFTMDTTGSMREEIDAAKAIALQIANESRANPVDFILSPYNDPETGPVTYYAEGKIKEFAQAIGNLPALGGFDCAELAFKGMMDALNAGPKFRSPMYVFTDANAKDISLMRNLKALANANSATINFFVQNLVCGTGKYDEYREMARFTSGQVLPLVASNDLLSYSLSVRNSLTADTNVATGSSNTTARRRRRRSATTGIYDIVVDDELESIVVTATVERRGLGGAVVLRSPSGKVEKPQSITAFASLYQVKQPELGKWKIDFTGVTSEYTYKVEAKARTAVDFNVEFVYQMRSNSPVFPVSHPRSGEKAKVIIQAAGVEVIDKASLRVSLLDEDGVPLEKYYPLDQGQGHRVYQASFEPPKHPFKVGIIGKTAKGNSFQRDGQKIFTPSPYILRVLYAGKMFSSRVGSDAPIVLQMISTNERGNFTVAFKATRGRIVPDTVQKLVRRSTGLAVNYHAPNDIKQRGKTDQIQVIAQNVDTKVSTDTVFEILLT